MLCEWFGTGKDSAVEEVKRLRNSALHTRSRIRFGPYELDLRTAELRKNTLRIRLQEQPFLILVALLERPGELVLREEIRNKLWPDDTVVEFDHGGTGDAILLRNRAPLHRDIVPKRLPIHRKGRIRLIRANGIVSRSKGNLLLRR